MAAVAGSGGYRAEALGQRLREERLKRGVSVRGLAREVGVSASMISQIETAKSQPSVSTLYAITTALGITVEELFTPTGAATGPGSADLGANADLAIDAEPGPEPAASADARAAVLAAEEVPAGAGGPAWPIGPARPAAPSAGPGGPADLDAAALQGRRLGPLVRPAQRRVLQLDSGVTWELLGDLPQYAVDFLLVTYAPGGTSSSSGELMRHPGSEYGCLLSGELVLRLDTEEFVLHPGDAISFDSTTPHCYRNDGDQPAVGVWFVLERGR